MKTRNCSVRKPKNDSNTVLRGGQSCPAPRDTRHVPAFTLIEMITVIAIIILLASLIIPITGAIDRKKKIAVAQAQLHALETAIDAYHARLGFYPPDNTNNPVLSPLFFELEGAIFTNANRIYGTRDGSSSIRDSDVQSVFNVAGIANSSASARSTDEGRTSATFVQNLRPDEVGKLTINGNTVNALLLCSVLWPDNVPSNIVVAPQYSMAAGLNPWRYVSTHPTNNPNSYDLWVDVYIRGKTNRISNWSSQPQIVP